MRASLYSRLGCEICHSLESLNELRSTIRVARVVNRIHADVEKLIATPDMRNRLAAIGFEPMGGTPQQFAAYLRQEIGKWNKVIKATGAKLE